MKFSIPRIVLVLFVLTVATARAESPGVIFSHALSSGGTPKYEAGFEQFDYVNPSAPKGGTLRDFSLGNFNSFNPFILKGECAAGAELVYDSLMVASGDEDGVYYGLLAEGVEMPEDRSWIIFHLRKEARFHDGTPVTAEDVVFSYNALVNNFGNTLKKYYEEIKEVEALDPYRVKFTFKARGSRELPGILAQLAVLPEHAWRGRDFSATTLDLPLGSGPYRISSFKQGRNITYERVKDYWAQDLPVCRGQYNFDVITFDYFRDGTVALEAFRAGLYDYRFENSAKTWATMYKGPAFDRGEIKRATLPHRLPQGMEGLVFNTRRPVFKNPRVRYALLLAFDYGWAKKRLYYDEPRRFTSYFFNSDFSAPPLPGPEETALLAPFKDELPKEVFTSPYRIPESDGSGLIRERLIRAAQILKEEGWCIKGNRLVYGRDKGSVKQGSPFRFQFLSDSSATDRLLLPFQKNLARLGIEMIIHRSDSAQYTLRMRTYDYDMINASFGCMPTPGMEMKLYWHSESADRKGARNLAGVKSPVVDFLVEKILSAPDRTTLVFAMHALDRVLLRGTYMIPFGTVSHYRLAYKDKFEMPDVIPGKKPGVATWWVRPGKDAVQAGPKEI